MKNETTQPALPAHTPGPWHIWHEHPANVGHVEPSGYNLWQLVPIATPCGMIRLLAEGDTLNRREANARLIAACPRMHDYITEKARAGDSEARSILDSLT